MSIDIVQVKHSVVELLKTLPVCKPSSNLRNWVVRCPYCGDSRTANHGHFSIRIDEQSSAPMIYRCLRCNDSGVLTIQTLEDLGLYVNGDLSSGIQLVNRFGSNSAYFKDRVKRFKVPVPNDTAENAQKLDYINQRLGINLTYEECAEYKIVLSIVEFMRFNGIKLSKENNGASINLPIRSLKEFEQNYLGFLSSNNNKLTMRDFTPDQHGFFGRYYKITIDLMNQSPNTFYGLKNQFDLLYNDSIDVHISEGTFDILSVYRNFEHADTQNSLFFASCGYGFSTILKYLIYMGVTTDINLHIYSDADKTDLDHLRGLKKGNLGLWLDRVIVHRNGYAGEKDFGVPKNRIQEYHYDLKL